MSALSPVQQKCLIFLKAHVETHGIPPSYANIGSALGIKSKHGVSNLLDILQRGGFIKRTSKARSIELLQSEYHHTPDCECSGCVHGRHLRDLKLVHALEVLPPISLIPKLAGLKPISLLKQVYWRSGFPRSEARSQPRKVAL